MVFDYARSLQISQEELDEWLNRINKINNKLSDYYYEQRLRKTLLVGSVGRGTAIIKTSDYDVIFVLPQEAYIRFDSYETNGQSALLQEVKGIISELYPRTEIKADGQVVDVFFDDGKIELVPVFKQPDGSFKFPDSHDGGKWKITKPVPEIDKATSLDNSSCAGCQWKYKPHQSTDAVLFVRAAADKYTAAGAAFRHIGGSTNSVFCPGNGFLYTVRRCYEQPCHVLHEMWCETEK